jgi:hypothetical protein
MTRRLTVAILALLAPACSSGDDGAQPTDVAEVLHASASLIWALGDEERMTGIDVLGTSDVVELSLDVPEARRRTDDAVDDLEAVLDDQSDAAASFREALQATDDLADRRAEVDRLPTGSLGDEHARASFSTVMDTYEAVISVILDSAAGFASSLDEAGIANSATLYVESLRLDDSTSQASRLIVDWTTVQTGETRASVAAISAMRQSIRTRRATLEDLAAGTPYESVVDEALATLDESGLEALLDRMLADETTSVDLAEVLESAEAADSASTHLVGEIDRILDQA